MIPKECPLCGKEQWALGQVVTAPDGDFQAPQVWHRRTQCRWCGGYHEELRGAGLWAISKRTDPIDPRGSNPFLTDEQSEEAS